MLNDCRLIDLPRISDPRGNLSFIEGGGHVPFDIKRVYYLYDVPQGADRGSHAHRALHQFFIPMAGVFDVELEDGRARQTFHLDRPDVGLYVCPMMWRRLDNFSAGAVCLVLASERYDERDYIRDYDEFSRLTTSLDERGARA